MTDHRKLYKVTVRGTEYTLLLTEESAAKYPNAVLVDDSTPTAAPTDAPGTPDVDNQEQTDDTGEATTSTSKAKTTN